MTKKEKQRLLDRVRRAEAGFIAHYNRMQDAGGIGASGAYRLEPMYRYRLHQIVTLIEVLDMFGIDSSGFQWILKL